MIMKKILLYIFISMMMAGCLKDDPYNSYPETQPIITVPNSNWPVSGQPIEDSLLNVTAVRDTLYLYAEVSWSETLGSDLQIQFQKDESLITAYNNKWFARYSALPDSCYQLPSLVVTIPAHTRRKAIPIVVFPDKIDNTQQYMLAYTIADAQGKTIASTYKSMLYPMVAQ